MSEDRESRIARIMAQSLKRTELAAHCAGMPRRQYLVARLRWCRDWTVHSELEAHLSRRAAAIARRERWPDPPRVRCHVCDQGLTLRAYLGALTQLALAEMFAPERWHSTIARAQWFGVSRSTWFRQHRVRYGAVWHELTFWLDGAHRRVTRSRNLTR